MAAARGVHFAAACSLFGVAAFPLYAYAPGEAAPRFPTVLRWAAIVSLVSTAAVLWLMAANMGGALASGFDPQVLSAATLDTGFGRVWLARIVWAAVVVALAWRSREARDPWLLGASGVLLASVALTGHSALPGGAPGLLHRLADVVHLLAAGWWIGGLLALALVSRRLGSEAYAVLERFSGVGYGAVAAIVLTGLFKTAILVATLNSVDSTAYGWTLLAKVALAGVMGLFALANRSWITPGLKAGGDPAVWLARLKTSVCLEFAVGLAVLAVVGALGAMAPPISQ